MALNYASHVLSEIRDCLPKRRIIPADTHSRLKELAIYRQYTGHGFYYNNGQRKIGVRITSRIKSTSSSFIPVIQRRTVTCLSGVKKVTDVPKMSFASVNCRSVINKASLISDAIVENNFDCVALTETWLDHKEDKNKAVSCSWVPSEYDILHVPLAARGGVFVLFIRNSYLPNWKMYMSIPLLNV